MRYYIVETQMTSAGDQNFVNKVQYSFGNALNYYYTRLASQAVVTEGYTAFHTTLLDENMNVVLHNDYTIPVEATE